MLDPDLADLLPAINARPPMHSTPIAELRGRVADPLLPAMAVGVVEDIVCSTAAGSVPARLYQPASSAHGTLLVFFHGGGFVFGSVTGYYDLLCRALCNKAQCHVLSIDYRLAPEHKFPAAADDGLTAISWAAEHARALGADPRRIVVAGGSAGGNLAAVTALRARDRGAPALRGQLLFYPVVALPDPGRESYRKYARGYYLTLDDMQWFWQQYLSTPENAQDPYAAPLLSPMLDGLPQALVITAECDPLRDEGEQYAQRLEDAGVDVVLSRYPGVVHGFLAFPIQARERAIDQAADWLLGLGR